MKVAMLRATDQVGAPRDSLFRKAWTNLAVRVGGFVLLILLLIAVLAPKLTTIDPTELDPTIGNLLPGTEAETINLLGETSIRWFVLGTDSLGRDLWSRIAFGGRVSLLVGVVSAGLALLGGGLVGAFAGYIRWLDGPLMRVMDGLMAIPGVVLAILLVAVWGASVWMVIVAIAVPEVPRVARLLRSVVLSVRQEAFIEAAQVLGTSWWKILLRHILPNSIAPLIVQGTYVCASAILVESLLSFLGLGVPPETPSWGNVMAEGRLQFTQYPHAVLLPGVFVAFAVFSVNLLGDGLKDSLDPKFRRRGDGK
jgi:peptide/nickel transport system permease protein